MTLGTHRFRAAANPVYGPTLTSESRQLFPVAPRTDRTSARRSCGGYWQDRDYGNVGNRWVFGWMMGKRHVELLRDRSSANNLHLTFSEALVLNDGGLLLRLCNHLRFISPRCSRIFSFVRLRCFSRRASSTILISSGVYGACRRASRWKHSWTLLTSALRLLPMCKIDLALIQPQLRL